MDVRALVYAVRRLAVTVRRHGPPRPDLRTRAGRAVKAEAQRLAAPFEAVAWWELLEGAEELTKEPYDQV